MKQAMQRHNDPTDHAVVVPVILLPCDWKDTPFAKLQALPRNALAVSKWPDKHEAYLNIVKSLKALIQGWDEKPPGGDNSHNSDTKKALSKGDKDSIRVFIGKGDTKGAIEEFMVLTKENNEDCYHQLLLLSGQLNELNRKNNVGLIPPEEANRTLTQINHAILELLKN